MKPVDVKDNTCFDLKKKIMIKILNLKVGDRVRILNARIFLLKGICQIGQKEIFLIKKNKINCTMDIWLL